MGRRGAKCIICTHEKKTDIEADIAAGTPYRQVAYRFATESTPLSKQSVFRHATKHMVPDLLAKRGEAAAEKLWSAKDTTREMLRDAIADLKLFRDNKLVSLVPGQTGQVRQLLETLARLDNQLSMAKSIRATINVTSALPPAVLAEFKAKYPEAFGWLIDTLGAESEKVRNVTPGEVKR